MYKARKNYGYDYKLGVITLFALKKHYSGCMARIVPGENLDRKSWMLQNIQDLQEEDGKIVFPNDTHARILMKYIPKEADMIANFSFEPGDNDEAGFSIYLNDRNNLNVTVKKHDSSLAKHSWLKVEKRNDDYFAYSAIADNQWNLIGKERTDFGGHMGIFVNSKENQFKLNSLYVYKTNTVTVNGLDPGMKVELLTPTAIVLGSGISEVNSVHLDFSGITFPLTGIFRIFDADNNLISQALYQDIFGGDVYSKSEPIDLYLNEQQITTRNSNLGFLSGSQMNYVMHLHNPLNVAVDNIYIQLQRDGDNFGEEWTELAPYNPSTQEIGEFQKVLFVEELPADNKYYFVMRVDRQQVVNPLLDGSFRMLVTGEPRSEF